MAPPVPLMKTKKQKRLEKEKAARPPVLGNFDQLPTKLTTLRPPIRGKLPARKPTWSEKLAQRRRHREERRGARQALRRKVRRPVFLLPKVDPEPDPEEIADRRVPPIHFRVNCRTKCLDVTVQLHHCPPQFIHLDPTPTHFVLDTKKWSTKYDVSLPYIEGIRCDPAKATASLDRGTLAVALPITVFPEKAKQRQARISAAIREGKRLRFVQARGGEMVGMRVVPAKERKRKRGADDEDADACVPIPRVGPKKKFVTDKSHLALMAEKAAEAEDSKVAARQAKLGATEAYFKERYAQRLEKKEDRRDIRERVLDRITQQQQQFLQQRQEKAAAAAAPAAAATPAATPALAAGVDARSKAAPGRKVSFARSNTVIRFSGEGDCAGKSKKQKRGGPTAVVEYRG